MSKSNTDGLGPGPITGYGPLTGPIVNDERPLTAALHRWTCRDNSPHMYVATDRGTEPRCQAAARDESVRAALRAEATRDTAERGVERLADFDKGYAQGRAESTRDEVRIRALPRYYMPNVTAPKALVALDDVLLASSPEPVPSLADVNPDHPSLTPWGIAALAEIDRLRRLRAEATRDEALDPTRLALAEHLLTCYQYREGGTCTHEWLPGKGTPVGPVNLVQAEAVARVYRDLASSPEPVPSGHPCGDHHPGPCRESECGHHEWQHRAYVAEPIPSEPGPWVRTNPAGSRSVLVELAPIVDGVCSGCGTKPSRETGSCRCLFRVDSAIRAEPVPSEHDPICLTVRARAARLGHPEPTCDCVEPVSSKESDRER